LAAVECKAAGAAAGGRDQMSGSAKELILAFDFHHCRIDDLAATIIALR
jgi:hypothetical protein